MNTAQALEFMHSEASGYRKNRENAAEAARLGPLQREHERRLSAIGRRYRVNTPEYRAAYQAEVKRYAAEIGTHPATKPPKFPEAPYRLSQHSRAGRKVALALGDRADELADALTRELRKAGLGKGDEALTRAAVQALLGQWVRAHPLVAIDQDAITQAVTEALGGSPGFVPQGDEENETAEDTTGGDTGPVAAAGRCKGKAAAQARLEQAAGDWRAKSGIRASHGAPQPTADPCDVRSLTTGQPIAAAFTTVGCQLVR